MSRYHSDPESLNLEISNNCANFLHYSWKTIACIFSHVTLISMVVSYCYLGALTFEALELNHEKEVKKSIQLIRDNTTLYLWNFTQEMNYLNEENFVPVAETYLKDFENSLLKSMAKDGWDGEEDPNKVQWTMAGALFYSIVVITTIGYGHITPKTNWGKVVTIFYAILGIPLMLLCLSNIGDIMATSFRFLYWRVCCYVCQKKPKKNIRTRSTRVISRNEQKFARSRSATSFGRTFRPSGKFKDSAWSDVNYHSDSDLRYPDEFKLSLQQPVESKLPTSSSYISKIILQPNQITLNENYKFKKQQSRYNQNVVEMRDQQKGQNIDLMVLANTPILCNKYVIGNNNMKYLSGKKRQHILKSAKYIEPSEIYTLYSSDEDIIAEPLRNHKRNKQRKSPLPNSSPKMMTPLGYGHRNKYLDDTDSDDADKYSCNDEFSYKRKEKPVPIWLCILLVISYILAGAYLFKSWESWNYLDAAYFCFITLTTIGFGDLVPAKGVSQDRYYATISIALCSLYLLFGISLLAMSFNLVQEEVISNVKNVAKTLGILKSDSEESDD